MPLTWIAALQLQTARAGTVLSHAGVTDVTSVETSAADSETKSRVV